MRRIVAICVMILLTLLSGCTEVPVDPSSEPLSVSIQPSPVSTSAQTPIVSPALTPVAYTLEEIGAFFGMGKDALLAEWGHGAQPFCTTNEGYWYSSVYRSADGAFTAGFYDGSEKEGLLCMLFGIGRGLQGLQPEMRFADIQGVLGKGDMTGTWRGSPQDACYSLAYEQNGFTVEFLSGKADGAGWRMECWKARKGGKPVDPKPFTSQYPELKADSEVLKNGITLGDIYEVAGLNQYELMKRMGAPDEVGAGGEDGHADCCTYKEAGLITEFYAQTARTFDEAAESGIDSITPEDYEALILNGIKSAVDFDQIEECLGEGQRTEDEAYQHGDLEEPEEPVPYYSLSYSFDTFELDFGSWEKDGTDWDMTIHPVENDPIYN